MATSYNEHCDVFIIGGGISGAAIAAECAQRGLSVQLCDQADVGGASSSQSDQIMPGAHHFLRHHNLPYFNKVIKEKALLKQRAPHLYSERCFVVVPGTDSPQSPISRIWLWLFQHWLQGNRDHNLAKRSASAYQMAPLVTQFNTASREPWVMQECMIDDARLVIENLLVAHQLGTTILPHHRFMAARRKQGMWLITLQQADGSEVQLRSRSLINAAGVCVQKVQDNIDGIESRCWIELKRKFFIVLPKFYQGDQAYLIESGQRHISVTPYLDHYCLIATTLAAEPDKVEHALEANTVTALIAELNQYFSIPITEQAVMRQYEVLQPFYSDNSHAATDSVEDYALDFNCSDGRSALISVFGGSFATHRAMAQEAAEMLGNHIPLKPLVSGHAVKPLPGGDMDPAAFDQFILKVASHYPWLPSHLLHHYCRTYGARCLELLRDATATSELGEELCPGLYQKEVEFLVQNEWVNCAEDILWRRTRLGLHASEEDRNRLETWLRAYLDSPSCRQEYTIPSFTVARGRTH